MKIDYKEKTGEQYNQFDSFDALWSDAYKRVENISPEVFNDEKNGLQRLPKVVRFQILMVLAVMWAFIFALITQSFISIGINLTTSIIAHALVIGGIIFTRKQLNIKYKFDSYHSVGRQRGYTWARDKQGNPYKVPLDPNDPGGEHE